MVPEYGQSFLPNVTYIPYYPNTLETIKGAYIKKILFKNNIYQYAYIKSEIIYIYRIYFLLYNMLQWPFSTRKIV